MTNLHSSKVLSVKNISVSAGDEPIVKDVSFDLYSNEILTLMGPSGSGKSTLLRVLNRLADLESKLNVTGDVTCCGKSIFENYSIYFLRKKIGLVFQKPCIFPGSIMRNVLFGVRHHLKLDRKEADGLAEEVLKKAHLWDEVKDRLNKSASILSLGQKQRLCFARVLAADPEILLLDEPTSSLDPHSTHEIEEALLEMKQTKSIILVTHQLAQGRRVSDRIVFLSSKEGVGRLIEQGSVEDLVSCPKTKELKRYLISEV